MMQVIDQDFENWKAGIISTSSTYIPMLSEDYKVEKLRYYLLTRSKTIQIKNRRNRK
jgi:hypothetical protein